MKPIDFETCESCHNDPHKGSLGPNCAGCHTEAGWKLIKNNQDTAFHDNTQFPLRGGHVGVACRNCHGPFPGQPARFKGLAFAHCSDCHEDSHMGQLRAKPPAKVVACEGCHTVNAFVPARFELEQHQTTKFPLDGAHAAVACRGCHPIDPSLAARIPAAVRLRLHAHKRPERFSFALLHPKKTPLACNGCHEDVHRGQFTEATLGRKGESLRIVENAGGRVEGARERDVCTTCHQTTSFADLTFNHDKDSRFPLTGKHATTPCGGCHRPQRVANGPPVVRYKPLDVALRQLPHRLSPGAIPGCGRRAKVVFFIVRRFGRIRRIRPRRRASRAAATRATRPRSSRTRSSSTTTRRSRRTRSRGGTRRSRARNATRRCKVAPRGRDRALPADAALLRGVPRRLPPRRVPGVRAVRRSALDRVRGARCCWRSSRSVHRAPRRRARR